MVKLLIIYGPTAVGKTGLADLVAEIVPSEIINADLGQFYVPFSVGTAKPNWQNAPVKHHLFDIMDQPEDLTVVRYRKMVEEVVQDVASRGKLPVIVGGSGFYVQSLFFRLAEMEGPAANINIAADKLWEKLNKIDPKRAERIHMNDEYRLKRALDIWYRTGKKPSSFAPVYDPIVDDSLLVIADRDRENLYERINLRTGEMLQEGWIEEAAWLSEQEEWIEFVKAKKLIGYEELLSYIRGGQTDELLASVTEVIRKKTRNYAKSQQTYAKMMERTIVEGEGESHRGTRVEKINLTASSFDLYIRQMLQT